MPANTIFYLILAILISNTCLAGKRFIIPVAQNFADGKKLGIMPGDTIWIEGGRKDALQLKNIIGQEYKPIIILNLGEVIIHSTVLGYGIKMTDSNFFKLSGSGSDKFKRGIKITNTPAGASGISIDGLCSNFEIDHIEISNTGFAGIMSKSDPACDHSNNRESFLQKNILIHDNYIHDTDGEGLYIGNSFFSGYTQNKQCKGTVLYPHKIENLIIHHNIIENTGWDGIQIGCATKNISVYDNCISNFGTKKENTQNNGLQIGEGSCGLYYNNTIKEGSGNGVIILGHGDIFIYNNFITMTGESGIFCDDRDPDNTHTIYILNNTVLNPNQNGIRWYNDKANAVFKNNLILIEKLNPQYVYILNDSIKYISENNYTTDDSISLKLQTHENIFQPTKKSPLFKKGTKITEYLKETKLPSNQHIGAFFYN